MQITRTRVAEIGRCLQTSNVSILDRRTLNKYHLRNARNEGNSTVELTTATTLQGDNLCNGGQIRVINTIKWIIGIYVDLNIPLTG